MASNSDDGENESATTRQAAAGKKKTQKPQAQSGSSGTTAKRSSRSTSSKTEKDDQSVDDDSRKRDPFTTTLERGYRRRMNGMVHHAQAVGTPANVATVADYVNQAVAEKLAKDEKRINNGQAFPEPAHMRTGRPQKRP